MGKRTTLATEKTVILFKHSAPSIIFARNKRSINYTRTSSFFASVNKVTRSNSYAISSICTEDEITTITENFLGSTPIPPSPSTKITRHFFQQRTKLSERITFLRESLFTFCGVFCRTCLFRGGSFLISLCILLALYFLPFLVFGKRLEIADFGIILAFALTIFRSPLNLCSEGVFFFFVGSRVRPFFGKKGTFTTRTSKRNFSRFS